MFFSGVLQQLFKHPRLKYFESRQGKLRVLEIGCGTGDNCRAFQWKNPEVKLYGLDLLPEEKIPEYIDYQVVDLNQNHLPYEDEYFDVILFIHVIEHLEKPLMLGPEINRVLKPGGEVFLETPNWTAALVPSFTFKKEQLNPFNFWDDPTHIRPWTKHSIFDFLYQACGLENVCVSTVRNWLKVFFDPVLMIGGLIRGDRTQIINAFWNFYGWCIQGIGVKHR